MVTSYSYASLPAELLGRVAELVHEQDLAFVKLVDDFSRAPAPVDRANHEGGRNVENGLWGYFYGRGVKAMAQVDRRTRAAALPHLYQSITSKQVHSAWFRYEVLGEALAQHVRRLEVFDNDSVLPKRAESIACALRKLPNLSSLDLGPCIQNKLGDSQPGVEASEGDVMLRGALPVALGKVTSLQLSGAHERNIVDALRCVSETHLRRLRLRYPYFRVPLGDDVQGVLRHLVGLVELEIESISADDVVLMRRDLRLPSVRSVFLETGRSYDEDLALAHSIAPSITRLTIQDPITAYEIGADDIELPLPLLPTLRTLVLDLDFCRDDFHEITLPGLEHYHVHQRFDCSTSPLNMYEVPFKSPSLRTITLSLRPVHLGDPYTTSHDTCAAAGVRLVVHTHPINEEELCDAKAFAVDSRSDPPIASGTLRANKLKELFDWAGRRAQWLCDVDDAAGLQELAEAAVRLQERFVLDDT
ncbi:hypothetical protein JCM9279_003349 [Rhodotorula babjevae]